jgi:hypothetical protein
LKLLVIKERVLRTLLHAIVYLLLHNLPNVLVQIANKIGLQNNGYNFDGVLG